MFRGTVYLLTTLKYAVAGVGKEMRILHALTGEYRETVAAASCSLNVAAQSLEDDAVKVEEPPAIEISVGMVANLPEEVAVLFHKAASSHRVLIVHVDDDMPTWGDANCG